MGEKKRKHTGGREKRMTSRIALNLTPNIPELVERVKKLRKQTRNHDATSSDLMREAMTKGLQQMVIEENKILNKME